MDYFGLDLGRRTLKLVQFRRKNSEYELLAFGMAPTPGKGLLSDSEDDLTHLAVAVKNLCRDSQVRGNNVVTAIPQNKVFAQLITLPKIDDEELASALRWEAEQYVPFPLDEVTLAHEVVGEVALDGKVSLEVTLVAVPSALIDKTTKVLQMAKLNPVSLETEIFSLARSLVNPGERAVVLIDFGTNSTDIAVIEDGHLIVIRSISTGGDSLTKAIASSLGMEESQAEAYKEAYGVDQTKLEGKIKTALDPLISLLLEEIEKTLSFYTARKQSQKIDRVVLTGGTSALPEISSQLAKRLNLEIQLGDPLANIKGKELITQKIGGNTSFLAVAVGLAMKELD
ncbi:MAG: type IV pilus assembly protein PilM [Candidatus Shapirobacteria bacterium]